MTTTEEELLPRVDLPVTRVEATAYAVPTDRQEASSPGSLDVGAVPANGPFHGSRSIVPADGPGSGLSVREADVAPSWSR